LHIFSFQGGQRGVRRGRKGKGEGKGERGRGREKDSFLGFNN